MNQAQLLEALRTAMEAKPSPEGFHTTKEIMRMMEEAGAPIQYTRLLNTITELWEAGEVEVIQVVRKTPSRMARVPAYRFKKAS